MLVQGSKDLDHLSLLFQVSKQGARSEVEELGDELAPVLGNRTTGRGLAHYTVVFVPPLFQAFPDPFIFPNFIPWYKLSILLPAASSKFLWCG